MTLPQRLTLIRHGKSEANIVQDLVKSGRSEEIPGTFADRHDSFMRLAPLGVEQAKAAGEWLRREQEPAVDRWYVSPHVRTRETAANLGLNGHWHVDDRFRERDWGEVFSHKLMDDEQKRVKALHEYYWKPLGGESMATGVRLRVESIMNSLYRRNGVKHTLAVGHGELLRMFQVVIERLTPEQFLALERDPAFKIHNTMILQYSTVNPAEPDSEPTGVYGWRRAVCPWDRSLDWNNGEWMDIRVHKHSDKELLSYVENYPPLLHED